MMNAFFRRAFSEYKRQKGLKKIFVAQTARISSVLRRTKGKAEVLSESGGGRADVHARASLLVLMPLVEIAWADGRVTRREMDAIMQAAETYRLVDNEAGYRELAERLLSRPIPNEVGRMWQDFRYLMEKLSRREQRNLTSALLAQAEFVAEQGTECLVGFLRGERIGSDALEALQVVARQLEKAETAAEESDIEKYVAAQIEKEKLYEATGVFFEPAQDNGTEGDVRELLPVFYSETELVPSPKAINLMDENSPPNTVVAPRAVEHEAFIFSENKPAAASNDSEKLVPLVPLVKVAWAEGRITRRERELIFSAAKRMGIEAGSPSYDLLASWLELHPTADFYRESLERLQVSWSGLSEDEKNLRRLDLLSDCVNIAEASGGTRRYPAGGRRVCDEEFVAVKIVAEKLNAPSKTAETASSAA